MFITVKTSNLI